MMKLSELRPGQSVWTTLDLDASSEQTVRVDVLLHRGKQLRFFADCAAKEWPLRGSVE